ncbi:aldo/keto reductase [Actinomadura rugatobispora]|uniref:Aldo/keto reductase n=1 Tax=Actinomadura rugatobispora TaxID=1994 RepID=A0ABW1ACR8_9ACTN|nr:hypothetical protein GCM10010200_045570 [Actinomadura rugatobispora]
MALLGLGTYRCRDVSAAARVAVSAGVTTIDTAPVYAQGTAQAQLAHIVAAHPEVRLFSKVGHMTRTQAQAALRAGVIAARDATRCHSISPAYLDYQIATTGAELDRQRLDLLYLHNPEHDAHTDPRRLLHQITRAFATCERRFMTAKSPATASPPGAVSPTAPSACTTSSTPRETPQAAPTTTYARSSCP